MTPAQVAAAATERLKARLRPAVGDFAAEVAADVRQRINVPVGRNGSKVIRSKPGEPPRRETGKYRGSWTSTAEDRGDVVRGTAGTTSKLGTILEGGTSRMAPRPHVGPAVRDARGSAASRIKAKL